MRAMAFILSLLFIVACGKTKAADASDPTDTELQQYGQIRDNLKAFAPDGFVVSMAGPHHDGVAAGAPVQQGNSLLFTGLAGAALMCDDGAYIAAAMQSMLTTTGGSLYHHPSIPTQMDFDDAVGFYRGVSERLKHCGAPELAAWQPGLKLHQSIAPLINVAGNVGLAAPFTWLRDAVLNQAGLADAPSSIKQAAMEVAVVGWAAADVAAKDACYRLHLGLQVFQTIEATGHKVSSDARTSFCDVTKDTQIPTIEGWCGRGGLAAWYDGFQPNQWQYRHQRCGAWETPDGNGDLHPGVDALIAYRDILTGEE